MLVTFRVYSVKGRSVSRSSLLVLRDELRRASERFAQGLALIKKKKNDFVQH